MSVELGLMIALTVIGVPAAVGVAILWLAGSWEVIDDTHVIDRLERRGYFGPIIRQLFGTRTRRLTYRRDARGRFRKVWRG